MIAKPIDKATSRAEGFLGEPVTVAVRIKYGAAPKPGNTAKGDPGVLAFMADSSTKLLTVSRLGKKPVGLYRSFPPSTPFMLDQNRFKRLLIAEFTIDGVVGHINRSDVKALMRMTGRGEFTRAPFPELVPAFAEYNKWGVLFAGEPEDYFD